MLEQLTKRIHELVPSTMELSFGCEVECLFGEGTEIILFECGKCPKHKTMAGCEKSIYNDCDVDDAFFIRFGYEEEGFGTYVAFARDVQNKEKYIILGHPIQLHHVLEAIIKYKERYLVKGYISGDKMNSFEAEILDLLARYDKTNPLSGQSEETIEFLTNLLN